MARSKSILALAVGLGFLAALAGYAGLKATAAQVAQNTSKHFVPVVVAATDLTFGTKLDRAQLRIAKYPKESLPVGAFSDIDSVIGQTTKIFLGGREPITATKLSSRGGGLSMLVRTGFRATSLEVNQVSGVSGFVLPGDRIDVLATVDGRGADQEAVTRTILQNAEVLASGQKTAQQDNKPITVQAVTILVDPMGAEKLALALHEGKLHLVLRNPEDSDTTRVLALNTNEMLNGQAGTMPRSTARAKAKKAPQQSAAVPQQVRTPAARPVKPVVRIIREAKVNEQSAPKDSIQ
ncbi:MAG TPA: Flp pilus assembly protein CpaB [Candidatus Eisenbacteria bacterium]|nr:Flp pilus assembly protein CpaB [Candidatus Eisenbacteria bacterium]